MDSYLNLEKKSPEVGHGAALALATADAAEATEAAERELALTLQLLASRAQQLTQASAATIAIREGASFVGHASAGPMAADGGTELRTAPALIEKSVASRQIVCCNDTRDGVRRDGAKYEALGIKAMMVMPLLEDKDAIGMFELLSARAQAFQDEDAAVLERLGGMVLTAMEQAKAVKRSFVETESTVCPEELIPLAEITEPASRVESSRGPSVSRGETRIQMCAACGFPVSEGRMLCVDCEEARLSTEANAPAFLSQLTREGQQSWLQEHFYTIGTVLMALLTVLALMLKVR
jgi:GAF domain-containing protein